MKAGRMNRIDEDIRSGRFAGLYLLYGEEEYLRTHHVNRLKKAIFPEEDQMNIKIWKDDEFDADEFCRQALTLPFFAEHRLLIVQNSGLFKKGGTELADFLPSVPQETIIVFSEAEVDARSRLFRLFKTQGVVHEFKRLNSKGMEEWILRYLGRHGRQIQRSALNLFTERTGSDMRQVRQEMEKLIDYTQGLDAIRLEDVRAVTTEHLETKVYMMINEMARHRQAQALERYNELLAMKEAPLKILVIMGRHYEALIRIKEMRERGMGQSSIAEQMGMKEYPLKVALSQASGASMEELRHALEMCVQADEDIKMGRIRDVLAAETVIAQLSSPQG
ncbi:MAG: DNA polymerase III subunit delta [Lachnospiraceae bacterium]|nr:DNA polymerase III subunit delta [Lachnospiraceae bacterium]